jgi:hypothetical protein
VGGGWGGRGEGGGRGGGRDGEEIRPDPARAVLSPFPVVEGVQFIIESAVQTRHEQRTGYGDGYGVGVTTGWGEGGSVPPCGRRGTLGTGVDGVSGHAWTASV